MERACQQEIKTDVNGAGHTDKIHGRFAVADAAENTGNGIVARDKWDAAGADEQILHGEGNSFRRGVHGGNSLMGAKQHDRRQRGGNDGHENGQRTDGACCAPVIFRAHMPADQHRSAGGDAEKDAGDGLHDLAADGHGGDRLAAGEPADNIQVCCAV